MANTPEQLFASREEEIAWLERQLETKKKEYASAGTPKESSEIAKEVLEGAGAIPEHELHPAYKADDETIGRHTHALAGEPHHKQIDELINFAKSSGIVNAIRIARKLGAHLLKDFHDRIIADGIFPVR